MCANHVAGGGDGVVTAAFDVVVGNYAVEGFSESTLCLIDLVTGDFLLQPPPADMIETLKELF